MCEADIPTGVSHDAALIVLIINIFLPGFGTILAGFFATSASWNIILIGFLQFLLFPLLIGWVWAILWGMELVRKSKEESVKAAQDKKATKKNVQKDTPLPKKRPEFMSPPTQTPKYMSAPQQQPQFPPPPPQQPQFTLPPEQQQFVPPPPYAPNQSPQQSQPPQGPQVHPYIPPDPIAPPASPGIDLYTPSSSQVDPFVTSPISPDPYAPPPGPQLSSVPLEMDYSKIPPPPPLDSPEVPRPPPAVSGYYPVER